MWLKMTIENLVSVFFLSPAITSTWNYKEGEGLRQDIKDLYSFRTYCLIHAVIHILAYYYISDKYRFHGGPCKIFPLEGKFPAYEIQTIASYEFCFVVLP